MKPPNILILPEILDLINLKEENKRPTINELIQSEKPMTVCIAMMATDIKKDIKSNKNIELPTIVYAADGQITCDGGALRFESPISKFWLITEYAGILMSSNNMTISYAIASKVEETILKKYSNKNITVDEIVNLVSLECQERIKVELEREVLLKWGLSYESFIKDFNDMSKDFLETLKQDFKEFKYDFIGDFIVFGIDDNQKDCPDDEIKLYPHISIINAKGKIEPRDSEGYAIIGSGYDQAFFEFTRCKCTDSPCTCLYDPFMELSDVIIRAYNAKKAAERTGVGVGEKTFMGMISPTMGGEVRTYKFFIDIGKYDTIFEILDNGRDGVKKLEDETNKKTMQKIKEFINEAIIE
jgi:hypothetical protein